MKVSSSQPFQIVYSLFQHEYLGYLFESFVIKLDEQGKLTLQHQNISFQNAKEFASGLDDTDYELIKLMDSMQQDAVIRHFHRQKVKPRQFFDKFYNSQKKDDLLISEINKYLERRRSKILSMLFGKMVFEMGKDGEPTWKRLHVMEEKATVLFHFRKNDDNTHYFPTIKHDGQKVEFNNNGSYIICKNPAWLVVGDKIYNFKKDVDGHKLLPFLSKRFIVIPKKVEETYYEKFIAPLVASFDVYAQGFEIKTENFSPIAQISFSEIATNGSTLSLFEENGNSNGNNGFHFDDEKILLEVSFDYGDYNFRPGHSNGVSVSLENKNGQYVFHRVRRNLDEESQKLNLLRELGLDLKNSKQTLGKMKALEWLSVNKNTLEGNNFNIKQKHLSDKKYFLGETSITVEVKENIDWFDIFAVVKFGKFEIPFIELRKLIIKKKNEIVLPNGDIAVIPASWISEYSELFAFADEKKGDNTLTLRKHHLALVQELETGNLAKVTMDRKLQKLRNFDEIEDLPAPKNFNGFLRPYQKAGYNWMRFLHQYRFGGCLADDMGLGKTIQTLAMLQSLKEAGEKTPSLLVMPTSLIYNWEMEAKKFTPELNLFCYTGTTREKNVENFADKDLILTSYGIVRLDIDLLKQFYFNYVILDESQAIKNPTSIISKAVRELNSRHKLILTGTPLENSTLDLWSQMSFINPGLIGNQSFFKNEFLNPIEKKKDIDKTKKLYNIIKPFIMRRHKSQVATELPEKVENVKLCGMTEAQEKYYEEVKSQYRNKLLSQIEKHGMGKSQIMLLQGLTKLRQIANHPKMIDPSYEGDSGKMEDATYMLQNAVSEDHKVLVFSQFVKHLQLFSDYLKSNNIDFAYLDGSTKNRMEQVQRFQNDDNLKIFLISLKAGGLGLNLTKAEYVFLLDPWWNPAVEAQAVDRAHRIGQVNKVFTYKFISKNSVEEKILTLQERKKKLASDLIVTEESFVKDLTKEDIELLFD